MERIHLKVRGNKTKISCYYTLLSADTPIKSFFWYLFIYLFALLFIQFLCVLLLLGLALNSSLISVHFGLGPRVQCSDVCRVLQCFVQSSSGTQEQQTDPSSTWERTHASRSLYTRCFFYFYFIFSGYLFFILYNVAGFNTFESK